MLELAGIVIGIVAASFIMLFGSRGLVDLFRGISQRRSSKKAQSTSSETQQDPTAADIRSPASIPEDRQKAQAATLQRLEFKEAVATLVRAFDYYAAAGEVDQAISVAGHPVQPVPGISTGLSQLISRALDLVPPDSLQAGRLLSRYGRVVGMERGEYHRALDAFDRSLAIADQEDDSELALTTLISLLPMNWQFNRWKEILDAAPKAIELGQSLNDRNSEAQAHFWHTMASLCTGDLEKALSHANSVLTLVDSESDRFGGAAAFLPVEMVCRAMGDWQAAREYVNQGLAASPQENRLLFGHPLLEYETGDFDRGDVSLERLLDTMRVTGPRLGPDFVFPILAIPIMARIRGTDSKLEIAEEAAHADLAWSTSGTVWQMVADAGMGLIAVLRGNSDEATHRYTALESHRGMMITTLAVTTDRLLGLMANTIGKLDRSAEHFEDALAFCRKAGYRPELAWTCCDYADCLLQREGERDRAKANVLLDESLAISTELGMLPLMDRVQSRREKAREIGRAYPYFNSTTVTPSPPGPSPEAEDSTNGWPIRNSRMARLSAPVPLP